MLNCLGLAVKRWDSWLRFMPLEVVLLEQTWLWPKLRLWVQPAVLNPRKGVGLPVSIG